MNQITRRDCLKYLTSAAVSGNIVAQTAAAQNTGQKAGLFEAGRIKPKSVAAVVTVYRKRTHADVLIGKILEGWKQDGGPGPALKLASLYVDQFPGGDIARKLAEKHNVPIFDSIEKTVTVGGNHIPVDGVISVGEHGVYPWNKKEQHLHPRRRFFEEITDAFQKYDRVVPLFSDKHLGPVWSDAKWMYDRARRMKIPFMAGSSLPVSFRKPDISVPLDCEIEAAVGIGFAGLDIYGSHTLDCFQSIVERRHCVKTGGKTGGETGVKWVQCLEGDAMWKAVDDGVVRKDVLEAALRVTPAQKRAKLRGGKRDSLFLFQYNNGLLGTVLMLPNYASGISIAVKLKGRRQPLATLFEERTQPQDPNFAYLLKAIERMIHTGRPSYPVERTLLSSGILDRAITSRFLNHKKLMTPELGIEYQPIDYPYAPNPDLGSDPTKKLG